MSGESKRQTHPNMKPIQLPIDIIDQQAELIEAQEAEIARLKAGRAVERIALGNALKLISVMQEQYEREVSISDVSETGEQQ